MQNEPRLRLAVDIGGTFTDVVLVDRDNAVLATNKTATSPDNPTRGALAGVRRVIAEAGVDIGGISGFIHGTTLATNALIERNGARTPLVTTSGFRDVIETRTESRFEQYDLSIVLPTPLIERKDRHVIVERLNSRGEVLVPFDEGGARALVEEIGEAGYESVAVGFLHSYRNPTNEQRFRDILLDALPDSVPSGLPVAD